MLFTTIFTALVAVLPVVQAIPFEKRALAAHYTQCKNSTTKRIALTFDDGPYIWDNNLRNLLKQYGAKATFFINGKNWGCSYDADRVTGMRNLLADGNEFGSHTWSHPHLPLLNWDQTHAEMHKAEQVLNKTLGLMPALFRAPYGEYQYSLSAIAARNQSHIGWTIDSGDSLGDTVDEIKATYQALINTNRNNAIVLNHNVQDKTVNQIMPWLLPKLKTAGYKMVTISECLGIPAYNQQRAPYPRDATWKC